MNFWNKTPLFRLVFPFIVGILAGYFYAIQPKEAWLAFAVFFLVFSLSFLIKKIYSAYAIRIYFGSLIHLLLFLLGYCITLLETDKSNELFLINISKPAYFQCRLLKPLKETEKCYGAEVEIYAAKQKTGWKKTRAKTLIYLKKDLRATSLQYGDCLLLYTIFTEVAGPQNPHELNYKNLAGLNGFHYKAFLKTKDWRMLPIRKVNILKKWAYVLRAGLFNVLKKHLPEKQEYGVAEALLIGGMEDIDQALSQAYSTAGVIHVLSVSGLHIGLVYMVLHGLLFFLHRNRFLEFIKCILLIGFLWFYAILSGFSPSVLRAAMMLSLVIYGRTIGRSTNTFNTLAASAFLLLLFSPLLIFNLGFQLSYLAVIGILILHPLIYKQWGFRFYLFDKIWQLISVSVAAQVFTFPLILYHFHQLPNYFIVANLLVIPLATLILFSGIALVIATKCAWLCNLIATCMHYFLKGINFTVQQIETWPYALTKNININLGEMIFLYIFISCILLFSYYKRVSLLLASLFFLLCFQADHAYEAVLANRQKKIIVYSISKLQAIDFIDGNKALLLGDSAIIYNKSKFAFHIQSNRLTLNTKNSEFFQVNKKDACYKSQHLIFQNNCIQFYKHKIYLATATSPKFKTAISKKISLDFIVINDSYKEPVAILLKTFNTPLIILDASFNKLNFSKREDECRRVHIAVYSVLNQGAFQK